ncbi:unnamed protein product [Dimorphilus gyrociliatus]|uniref:Glycosyltransferase family 92 protein n=1 Tax=Dimorphilus gyrociliatus TaxID=2664684 RepID=A0A7I8VA82_9ANNE|nr:unnamed protein product [Dimorphilus gyrociliatus]
MFRWKCLSLKLYIIVIICLYIAIWIFSNIVGRVRKPLIDVESPDEVIFRDVAESQPNVPKREALDDYSHHSQLSDCWGERQEENYKFTRILSDFYIFSAFYDNRTKPLIRLISLNRITVHPKLYCVFRYNDNSYESKTDYYEMCENHRRTFGGHILSCTIPRELNHLGIPCTVELTTLEGNRERLNVQFSQNSNRKGKFGICIPPLFNDFQYVKFIEFIELNRILGANTFYIYFTETYEENLVKILKYYKRENIVKLIPWKLPEDISNRVWYHGQSIAIHDCLYRFMFSVEYLIFQDLDEFIIPTQLHKWSHLLEKLDNNHIDGFCFECFYFQQKAAYTTDTLWSLTFKQRTVKGTRQLSKCLVKSDRIFEMGIHHISKFIKNTSLVLNVHKNDGRLFHFRKCKGMFGDICYRNVEDTILEDKYSVKMIENVNLVFEANGFQ